MSVKNKNLQRAQRVKFDEYYTRFKDVKHFFDDKLHLLSGKTIYLPCDSEASAFWLYLTNPDTFNRAGIVKITATHLNRAGASYRLDFDGVSVTKAQLDSNGDFRSAECQDIWAASDLVITNGPFSLFRDFFDRARLHQKPFIVLCSYLAATYSNTFESFKRGDFQLYDQVHLFRCPDGSTHRLNNICWATYLLPLPGPSFTFSNKSIDDFSTIDNYTNVFECSRCADLPNIPGVIFGVPVTMCQKIDRDKIEVVGLSENFGQSPELGHTGRVRDCFYHGKRIFKRVFVRVKPSV